MDPSFLLLAALAALPDGSPDPTGGLPNRLSFSVPGGFFSRPPGALMECDGRCVILASALGQLTADVAPCLHFDSCDRYLRADGNGRKISIDNIEGTVRMAVSAIMLASVVLIAVVGR